MNKFGFAGVGLAIGMAGTAALLTTAEGATRTFTACDQLSLIAKAFDYVHSKYVHEVDDSALITSAINGMVSSLDPHSSYMDAKDYADMRVQNRGQYGGLGLEITMEDSKVKVVSPIDDTPAARAGIKTGDVISTIDGISVQDLPLGDVTDRLRGPIGSQVTLRLVRSSDKTPVTMTLTRMLVHVDPVKFERKGDVGYIRIASFTESSETAMRTAVASLKTQIGAGLKGYVLDLRNDPGGLLDQAIAVADDFLTGGEIVSTRGRTAEDTERFLAHSGEITGDKPVVVLINEGTASASEIVAGALQDQKRATIIGMTSFGKGSVQTIIPLGPREGALRLTTSKYFTPSGHSIQARGIVPDIAVANRTRKDQADADQSAHREAALARHLDGERNRPGATAEPIYPAEGKKYDDFQLSYALDRLNDGTISSTSLSRKNNRSATTKRAR